MVSMSTNIIKSFYNKSQFYYYFITILTYISCVFCLPNSGFHPNSQSLFFQPPRGLLPPASIYYVPLFYNALLTKSTGGD